RVMGLWATCYQLGSLAASVVTRFFLDAFGFRGAFIAPGLGVAAVGIVVLLVLRPGPLASRGDGDGGEGALDAALIEERRAARRRVLRSVSVWFYGASYFCIKLIRYSILFWLPFYLEKQLGYTGSAAAYRSTSFEIGGFLGALGLGALSDTRPRTPRSVFA